MSLAPSSIIGPVAACRAKQIRNPSVGSDTAYGTSPRCHKKKYKGGPSLVVSRMDGRKGAAPPDPSATALNAWRISLLGQGVLHSFEFTAIGLVSPHPSRYFESPPRLWPLEKLSLATTSSRSWGRLARHGACRRPIGETRAPAFTHRVTSMRRPRYAGQLGPS